jgi:hypothetical protein
MVDPTIVPGRADPAAGTPRRQPCGQARRCRATPGWSIRLPKTPPWDTSAWAPTKDRCHRTSRARCALRVQHQHGRRLAGRGDDRRSAGGSDTTQRSVCIHVDLRKHLPHDPPATHGVESTAVPPATIASAQQRVPASTSGATGDRPEHSGSGPPCRWQMRPSALSEQKCMRAASDR